MTRKMFNELVIPHFGYPKNALGSITNLLTFRGLLHKPTITEKENNTLVNIFYKTLNHFQLHHWRGIAHDQKMN
jgi:hypothetical protein